MLMWEKGGLLVEKRLTHDRDKRAWSPSLKKILMASQFEIEARDRTWKALADFRASRIDFPDCLIGRISRGPGCDSTFTFDRSTCSLDAFSVLSTSCVSHS